jgi:hypothetical protein
MHANLLRMGLGRVDKKNRGFVPKLPSLDNFETIHWQMPEQLCIFSTL